MMRYQRLGVVLTTLLLVLLLTSCRQEAIGKLVDGQSVYLSTFQGKWLVVNYWAKWCKPCLTELPELAVLAKNNPNIIVLGVSFDPLPKAEVEKFAKELHLNFPMLASFNYQYFGLNDIATLPTTLIINPQGQLIETLHGPQTQAGLVSLISGRV